MADKSIDQLNAVEKVYASDLFVLQQSGTAKKLTGQVLENWLLSFADGHGGIQSIAKLSTSGLADTYRITLADTTTFDFVVNNGRGITGISKTSTSGLVDTYTISYNNGTTGKFTVTNGEKGDKGNNAYIWIKYASKEPTESSHSMGDIPDDWIGIYSGNASTAPTDWKQYKWFQIKGEKGDTGSHATLVTKSVTYQVSDSGTIIPSGAWGSSIPVVSQGKYLWTKTELQFNSGDPIVFYSVARMGKDGSGSVSSVSGVSPDETGNVTLTPADVGALAVSGGYMEGEISMNGQPISGLNDPTEDTQAARKGYVDASVRKAAPRNLLDNSDFRNPVNQREQTSYSGNVYSIDRWKLGFWSSDGSGKANLSVESNGIRLFGGTSSASIPNSCSITQKLDASEMLGKIYTIAVSVTSLSGAGRGRILVGYDNTFVSKDNIKIGINILTFAMPSSASTFFVGIGNEASESGAGAIDALIEWAALYEGYYTAETLPEYQPKGYGAELLECQRYYQIRSENNIAAVDMRPTMRLGSPTITSVSGGYAYSADL